MLDAYKYYGEKKYVDTFVESLRRDLDLMLNEAYNIGRLEGYYEGLSEGRRDAQEGPAD